MLGPRAHRIEAAFAAVHLAFAVGFTAAALIHRPRTR